MRCPYMEFFTYENTSPVLQWYKECRTGLLEDKRFQIIKASPHDLKVNNATRNDEGIYICQTSYIYMERWYNVSRVIQLSVRERPPNLPTEILYPKNNSIEVELGKSLPFFK
uniref:Ig-like domain-containing protein n=1 Tax=Sphenodon punctatus TaxID=8508 RepID=A0A8D0H3X2_SPHPU